MSRNPMGFLHRVDSFKLKSKVMRIKGVTTHGKSKPVMLKSLNDCEEMYTRSTQLGAKHSPSVLFNPIHTQSR